MNRLDIRGALLAPVLSTLACTGSLAVAENGPHDSGTDTSILGLEASTGSQPDASPQTQELDASTQGLEASAPGKDAAANACLNGGDVQQVVTLSDLRGQWIEGCDPSSPPLPAVVSGAADTAGGLPRETVGFEIDAANNRFYALVPSNGGYARASGPGSVWWADDVYSYGALPDGGPQEYLAVTNANLLDSGTGEYTQMLAGWGVEYRPAADGGAASLTLLQFGGGYSISLLPPGSF